MIKMQLRSRSAVLIEQWIRTGSSVAVVRHRMSELIMVIRRAFLANAYPNGSPERRELNKRTATSEYYPSKPYLSTLTGQTYRTRALAEAGEVISGLVKGLLRITAES